MLTRLRIRILGERKTDLQKAPCRLAIGMNANELCNTLIWGNSWKFQLYRWRMFSIGYATRKIYTLHYITYCRSGVGMTPVVYCLFLTSHLHIPWHPYAATESATPKWMMRLDYPATTHTRTHIAVHHYTYMDLYYTITTPLHVHGLTLHHYYTTTRTRTYITSLPHHLRLKDVHFH